MIGDFFKGIASVLHVTSTPPLYRYPYRTSAEALRGDMKRIGSDIQASLDKMQYEGNDYGE